MRTLAWIGLPEEIDIPVADCVSVIEYPGVIKYVHYDQAYVNKIMFNPKTQTFYSIVTEGIAVRRRYAHLS